MPDSVLSPAQRRKLIGALGMLGSDNEPTRSTAAAVASKMLADLGLTWADILVPAAAEQARLNKAAADPDTRYAPGQYNHRDQLIAAAQLIMTQIGIGLSPWEASFVASMQSRARRNDIKLTAKQKSTLEGLHRRALNSNVMGT